MDEKWMQRRLRWLTLFCVLISIALTVGGGIAAALLDNMFKGSLNEQMAAETAQYKANIERKIDADIQTLATLSVLWSSATPWMRINLLRACMSRIIRTALFEWAILKRMGAEYA